MSIKRVFCEFRDLFTEDIEERLAWLCISTANRRLTAGWWGGILFQRIILAQSVLKSRFYVISFDFCDFTHFRFFQAIQHVKHVLTCKIVRFSESKRDFNNLAGKATFFPSASVLCALLLWSCFSLLGPFFLILFSMSPLVSAWYSCVAHPVL